MTKLIDLSTTTVARPSFLGQEQWRTKRGGTRKQIHVHRTLPTPCLRGLPMSMFEPSRVAATHATATPEAASLHHGCRVSLKLGYRCPSRPSQIKTRSRMKENMHTK